MAALKRARLHAGARKAALTIPLAQTDARPKDGGCGAERMSIRGASFRSPCAKHVGREEGKGIEPEITTIDLVGRLSNF